MIQQYLFSIKEFNLLVAIIQSLMQAKWLTPTWEYVPTRHLQTYQQLHSLINPKTLREREKSDDVNTPTIPYLEAHLRSLASVHNVAPDTLAGDLVNFEKRRNLYDIYAGWQVFQTHPYTFDHVPMVHDFLLSVEIFDTTELKKRAASIPPSPGPPASRPTPEDLPNPPKRPAAQQPKAVAAARAGSSADLLTTTSDSTGLSPRGSVDETTVEQLRSVVLSVMNDDRQLISDLVAEAKRELQEDLLSSLRAYTASVHDEMIIMNGQYGLVEPAHVRDAAKRIVARKFPTIEVQEWSTLDSQGLVYGWQEEIYLFVADDGNASRYLVSVSPHVDAAALGAILRMVDLYSAALGVQAADAGYQLAIITPSVNEHAVTIAQQRGVHIVAF